MLTWRVVESSNVLAIGWRRGKPGMVVRFLDGSTYFYRGVSRQRAVTMAYAVRLTRMQSVGKYLHQRIKGEFAHRRLQP